jgi:hypothetical protein
VAGSRVVLCPLGAGWRLPSADSARLTLPVPAGQARELAADAATGPSLSTRRAESAFQFSSDDLDHPGEIMHDVIVLEADYAIAAT